VPPTSQERSIFKLAFHPSQLFSLPCFKKGRQVEREYVTETTILSVTAGNNKHLIADDAGRVEPPSTGLKAISFEFDLFPPGSVEVEEPGVVKVAHSFSSEHHQVWKFQLRDMVGAFPGSQLILFGVELSPVLGAPVQHVHRVESLLVGSAAPENNYLIGLRVVVH